MTALIHAAVPVLENVRLARDTYRIRLAQPELAAAIRPGQFLMLRLPGSSDPLLGRPFALYDTVLDSQGKPSALDVVYLVVGKVTGLLARMTADERVEIWGPLGNGFPELEPKDHVALVAGGIGQTPFLACVRELLGTRGYGGQPGRRKAQRVSLFYGVRSRTWRPASRTSARPERRSTCPATMAASVSRGMSRNCCGSILGPITCLAADRSRCCTPWRR